jgi:ABC-2 type transport system permease protein
MKDESEPPCTPINSSFLLPPSSLLKKTFIISRREYLAAVKSKAFLITVILMPVMMLAGIVSQKITRSISDTQTYKVALVDRSADGAIGRAILARNEVREREQVIKEGKQVAPRFDIQLVPPAPRSDKSAVDRQRLELSQRVQKDQLLAFVEIGEDVGNLTGGINVREVLGNAMRSMMNNAVEKPAATSPSTTEAPASTSPGMSDALGSLTEGMNTAPDEGIIRYTSNRPTFQAFRGWLQSAIIEVTVNEQFRKLGIDPATFGKGKGFKGPIVLDRGLARQDASGSISYEENRALALTNVILPLVVTLLMFMIIVVGTSPLTTNIIEEKQQRIAEVLLGSVKPFELMMGKLLGGVGVALTLAAIYFTGILITAHQYDVLKFVPTPVIGWFVLFTVLATLLYGSIFSAAGAAVTTVKEAQAIITPVILLVTAPLFVFSVVLEYPSGVLARTMSYFPITAPLGTMLRLTIPPGLPAWEIALGVISSLVGTALIVWIAGRIFRVGMLMNSRPASFGELVRWVVKG